VSIRSKFGESGRGEVSFIPDGHHLILLIVKVQAIKLVILMVRLAIQVKQ
jgi:hypothetical protein